MLRACRGRPSPGLGMIGPQTASLPDLPATAGRHGRIRGRGAREEERAFRRWPGMRRPDRPPRQKGESAGSARSCGDDETHANDQDREQPFQQALVAGQPPPQFNAKPGADHAAGDEKR